MILKKGRTRNLKRQCKCCLKSKSLEKAKPICEKDGLLFCLSASIFLGNTITLEEQKQWMRAVRGLRASHRYERPQTGLRCLHCLSACQIYANPAKVTNHKPLTPLE